MIRSLRLNVSPRRPTYRLVATVQGAAYGSVTGRRQCRRRNAGPVIPFIWRKKKWSGEIWYAKQTEVLTYATNVKCQRLGPIRLHELHESKLPFVSRIELMRSRLSNVGTLWVSPPYKIIIPVYYERSAKRGASLLLYMGEKSVWAPGRPAGRPWSRSLNAYFSGTWWPTHERSF